ALLRTRPGDAGAGGGGACADGPGGFPPRPQPAPSQLGRAYLQTDPVHSHAARRPLRRPRGARAVGQRPHSILPNPALSAQAHTQAPMATGALVILAVIPPRTTPKTGGVQTDGEANLTSEDDTSRHPMDGWEATHSRSVAGSRPASPTNQPRPLAWADCFAHSAVFPWSLRPLPRAS